MKVLIIGIDGMSWNVVEPLLKQRRLPNLGGFVARGSHGKMDNLGESRSPVIWTTIATGKVAEDHRILGFTGFFGRYGRWRGRHLPVVDHLPWRMRWFLQKLGLVYRSGVMSYQRKIKALWNIFTDAGRTVGIANWWVTYPAEPVRGFNITDRANYARMRLGMDLVSKTFQDPGVMDVEYIVYPPQGLDEICAWHDLDREVLLEHLRRFALIDETAAHEAGELGTFRRDDPLAVLKFSIYQDQFTVNAFTSMLKHQNAQPDLLAVYFAGLDAICHTFWKYAFPDDFGDVATDDLERYGETIRSYYSWMDTVVGDLIALVDHSETVTLVLSDHGFESAPEKEKTQKISGSHDSAPDGVFLLKGPHIRAGQQVHARSIDIAPTVLHLLGLPVGRDMPGHVLECAIEQEHIKANPLQFIDSWETLPGTFSAPPQAALDHAVDKQVLDRLKALGYFE